MPPVASRPWIAFGQEVRDLRLARGWSVREVAARARVSPGMVYRVEAGQPASSETAVAIATALNRRAELHLVDPRRREARPNLSVDVVHSAMGEFEAAHFRALRLIVGIDEPYQHYQFSGRADVIAYDLDARALFHIENRTRFPDFQEMAGAFNNKRAYRGADLANRLGVPNWRSETHVIAALWSVEVLHALGLRTESFRSLCPDPTQAFSDWWEGRRPKVGAGAKVFVVLDPNAEGRERVFVGLDDALKARPRYRGYSEAAAETRARNGRTTAASSAG